MSYNHRWGDEGVHRGRKTPKAFSHTQVWLAPSNPEGQLTHAIVILFPLTFWTWTGGRATTLWTRGVWQLVSRTLGLNMLIGDSL